MSTIAATKLDFTPLSARIGAEIRGLDLSGDLDPDTVTQIREALNRHKALVFREANILTDEDQVRFASHFGPLTKAHPTVASVEGEENVLPVDSENGSANTWHTDVTFVLNPPQASTLRSIEVPAYGGETLIATTEGAYRDLPEELRRFANTLWAIHTNDYDYSVPKNLEHATAEERRKEFTRVHFETAHPVVRVHPLTGEHGLFIGGFAQRLRIVGLSNTESRDILRLLQAYVTRPENVVRVTWELNQVVLFDNRITQHYAPDNYDSQPRRLNRVTIAGDIPVGVDGTVSQSLQGDSSVYSVIAPVDGGRGSVPATSGAPVTPGGRETPVQQPDQGSARHDA
ncbi:TauD/TfdA dioxygenase family protein [Arthrobacter woluwensis]|uniref:TauD/TfdA dioxygenase family protein n=1 Tax=Arthrobacter woluwensis TaxID=156980 RepID=UPI001AAE5964|nr:TauD/TfdA family dioxygenase [Arthrobacter woluwensis]QTF71729.1 TauD/TfdA family dioxygenase [Arthrobacter woluwensis]